ncbi:hypothetical protein SLEP1_g54915 [Rubroshorea leprosula]|uniref:RRM domain-containing protein n=1 Tax=Rubroshorea leprosula TaxID=152421 RepID=A0AAV5MEM7_9ROSI|nr:hypothetical protein SLEP1_g54915 [Rubroshorea leprosula]
MRFHLRRIVSSQASHRRKPQRNPTMKNVKPTVRSKVLRLESTMKNANANIGERSLPSRLPMYDRGLLKNATSYLFSNFPEDWSPKRLWFLFATYGAGLGQIVDVCIPRKKDKKGNKFGFIRFSEVRDKARLEKMLKMICFGTEQLRISLAKERKPLQPALKHPRPLPPPPPPGTLKTKSYAEALLNGLNSPYSDSQTRRTNAMPQTCPLVTEKTKSKTKLALNVEDDMEDSSWLNSCATGEVLSPYLIPGLQQTFWENGFSHITTTPMGGCKILLQNEDLNKISRFIEEEEGWWSKWFRRIKLWTPSDIAEERFAWIRITGLPLQVWNQKTFERIGNKLGSFIKVDPHTADRICLDAARVLITTTETTQVYDSDTLDSDDHVDSDSDQNSGGGSMASEDEVEQPPQTDNGHFCDLSKLPVGSDSHEEKAGSSNKLGILGNDARGNTEASVSDLGGGNRVLNSLSTQLSSNSHSDENGPKVQNGQNTPMKAQISPYQTCGSFGQDLVSRIPAQDPLEINPHQAAESAQSTDHLQNVKTLRCVTRLNHGRRKKISKQAKRCKKRLLRSKQLGPSLLDSFWERSRRSAKDVEELDIKKFVEFGKRLGLCFVGNEDIFATKFLTFNTRGLANSIKRRKLRSMVHQEQINLLMIQETKAEIVDEQLCRSIWGQGNFDWCAKSSNGKAGGLLCIWDSSLFEKTRVIEGEGFLGVEGL